MLNYSSFSSLTLLSIFLSIALLGAACGSAMPGTSPATLKITAEPVNTSVYVNDRFVGSARVLAVKPAAMRPGVKFLTFTAPGYFPHDLRVDLPPGATTIAIKLRPIPP